MIRSMTGFGAGRGEAGGEAISVELRSVNGKFCEVKPRLPRELASLEPELVKTIKGRVSRGVIEAFVRREASGARGSVPHVDLALAAAYAKSFRELKDSLGLAGEPTVQDLAAMEGVISLGEAAPDLERASEALQAALGAGIDALDQMRRREGEALARDLSARLDTIEKGAREVARLAPLQVESVRDRLSTRIAELSRGVPLDPARLAQEVALFADRTDVAEELTRLASHLAQARGLVSSQAPAGRKLEFLVQELNREINTIGSKSQHAGIAATVVELKAELERIREQVQNVE
ncbi:MAG TPA: YicC/YloC family endoribonuclease [Myxococcales bacterium]|nr:YicC/YloC family endoribonuclease [Myxococcales bacterium]